MASTIHCMGLSVIINKVMQGVDKLRWFNISLGSLLILSIFITSGAVFAGEDHWKDMGIIRLNKRDMAPAFSLPLLSGAEVGPHTYKGKVIILNFWASWCPPCRREMPSMERLYRDYKDKGVVILGVNDMESEEDVRSFYDEYMLSFPTVLDKDGKVFNQYGVLAIPTSFIIDREGRLIGKVFGPREWDSEHARALIKELLGK